MRILRRRPVRLSALGPALGLALIVASTAALAVEIEPGRIYAGGTRLDVAELGIAFTVPSGWLGTLPVDSEVFVLQAEADPRVVIMAIAERTTRDELAATMRGPIPLGEGRFLRLAAPLGERGETLTGRYDVGGGSDDLAAYGEALAGSHGIAVAYLLIAGSSVLSAHEPAVRALSASTDLGAPAAAQPPAAAGGSGGADGDDRWDTYLKGRYIVRYYTTTGYTEETHLWLCSDGTFSRSSSAGGFGGGASGAYQGGGSGRWTASGAGEHGTLDLHFFDGTTSRYQLRWDYQENALYLDGKRWLRGDNEHCP